MEGDWLGKEEKGEGEDSESKKGGRDVWGRKNVLCRWRRGEGREGKRRRITQPSSVLSPALLSFFIGLCGVFFVDSRAVLEGGFFQGYSLIVLLVITLQVSGHARVVTVLQLALNTHTWIHHLHYKHTRIHTQCTHRIVRTALLHVHVLYPTYTKILSWHNRNLILMNVNASWRSQPNYSITIHTLFPTPSVVSHHHRM